MKNPALSGGVFHNNTVEQKHWPLTRVFQATRATHLVVERCARSSGRTRYFDSSHDAITPGWSIMENIPGHHDHHSGDRNKVITIIPES